MPLTTRLVLSLEAILTSIVGVNNEVSSRVSQVIAGNYANGVAANQADKMYSAERTLGPSATEDLDLAGVLLDVFGAAITLAEIAALVILADPTNNVANNVIVGAAAANPWIGALNATGTVTLRPGQFAVFGQTLATDGTGFPVTAATGDLLKVANSAGTNSVKYKVTIIGRSA